MYPLNYHHSLIDKKKCLGGGILETPQFKLLYGISVKGK